MGTISTSVPTDGNYNVQWIPTIAGPAGPSVAEWNAGKDLTHYFTPDGWTPATEQATVSDDRLAAKQVFEQPGKDTDTLETIFVTNPGSAPDDVAALTLLKNTTGFLGVRFGMDEDTPIAAGQKVTIRPIKCGTQRELTPEANGVFKIAQKQFITNTVRRRVAVVA